MMTTTALEWRRNDEHPEKKKAKKRKPKPKASARTLLSSGAYFYLLSIASELFDKEPRAWSNGEELDYYPKQERGKCVLVAQNHPKGMFLTRLSFEWSFFIRIDESFFVCFCSFSGWKTTRLRKMFVFCETLINQDVSRWCLFLVIFLVLLYQTIKMIMMMIQGEKKSYDHRAYVLLYK